jgi:hypothetical protein
MKKLLFLALIMIVTGSVCFAADNYSGVEEKYANVKGGWKYLKWGMSIDEVNYMLEKNGQKKFICYAEESTHIAVRYSPKDLSEYDTELIIRCPSGEGDLYFYNFKVVKYQFPSSSHSRDVGTEGKLMGRSVDMTDLRFLNENGVIMKTLAEKYKGGKIYKTSRGGKFSEFFYKSRDMLIFTGGNIHGSYIQYFDPVAVKQIADEINSARTREREEERKKIRDKI